MKIRRAWPVLLGLLWVASPASDVLTAEKYIEPPSVIADIVTAPRHQNVSLSNLSPDRSCFLVIDTGGMPSLADLARPHLNLGGVQIDPAANRARSMTTRDLVGMKLLFWKDRTERKIEIPAGATFSAPTWSTKGDRIAFIANFETGSYLFVADVATGKSRQLSKTPLLATSVNSIDWTADDRFIVAVLIPDERPALPTNNHVPTEPLVRVTQPGNKTLRTFPSLLSGPKDAEALEYFLTGQLALIDTRSGDVKKVGKPAMFRSVNVAPDGSAIRVSITQRPFSYIVPVSSFGFVESLWDLDGNQLAEIANTPLRVGESDPQARGGRQQEDSKRSLTWRPDGKGLSFLQLEPTQRQAEGEQTGGQQPPRKDRVMQWLPPYSDDSAKVIFESETRIGSVQYSADFRWLLLTETASGQEHLYAVNLDEPTKKYTIYKRRTDEFYDNPGSLMTTRSPMGVWCVRMSSDGSKVYLSGTIYSRTPETEAPRPFVDSVMVTSGEKVRVFESSPDAYEQVLAVLDDDFARFVIQRQSPKSVPDSYLRDFLASVDRQMTTNRDYAPGVTAAQRKRIQVTRTDGIKFWVNITLPKDWTPGTRLPAFFWFYPQEFTDQRAYDNSVRRYNKNLFPAVCARSVSMLTLLGYAVIEPDCPIIGPTGRMNDNYVPDLRNNLYAVIGALDREGMIDMSRLGIGGHSYGAFSTLNAMVHTPFFKAGIAGDGAYNRSLTPAGFQSESRMLWDARETYMEMSPFMYLNRLTGAVLFYHGMDDQNVGTFPINSERAYHALEVLGKTAALYMYPYEDHSPATRETNLDLWARWIAWLDKYLKGN